MRKLLISTAAAASVLAVATPAAAQWTPQPVGYASAYADPGALTARLSQLRAEIRRLGMSNMLRPGEFRRLDWEAVKLDQRVRRAAFDGMSPREAYDIERRIARLQQRIQLASMTSNRRFGYGYGGYGYNGNGYGGYGNYGAFGGYSGRSNYYGQSRAYSSVRVVRRMPSPMTTTNVVFGNRDMQRMSSMRNEGNRDMQRMSSMRKEGSRDMQRMSSMRNEGSRDMQRMSSMRNEGSRGFSSGDRGMRRGGGQRGGRD